MLPFALVLSEDLDRAQLVVALLIHVAAHSVQSLLHHEQVEELSLAIHGGLLSPALSLLVRTDAIRRDQSAVYEHASATNPKLVVKLN